VLKRYVSAAAVALVNARDTAWMNDKTPLEMLNLEDDEKKALSEAQQANRDLRFEIETFYLWSSIFLSKLAQFLGSFMSHGKLRGVRVKSHNTFWPVVAKAPDTFPFFSERVMSVAAWLGKNVIDYRDYHVTHTNDTENRDQFLIKNIVFVGSPANPEPVVISFKTFPDRTKEEPESFASQPLERVLPTIIEYANLVLDVVEAEARDRIALTTPPPADLSKLFDGLIEPQTD
jgi:hypothetical protein